MTEVVAVYTQMKESRQAGQALGWQIGEGLEGAADAVIVFAAPGYEHRELLVALQESCHPGVLVGCSSAGEFTRQVQGQRLACAVALRSGEMGFRAVVGRGMRERREEAAREIASGLKSCGEGEYRFRSALVLVDALAGFADDFVEKLTWLTLGEYQFFGGAAGDNARACYTPVFCGTEVLTDAAVALEMCSRKPLGVGVSHGWQPVTGVMQVTETDGFWLKTFDGRAALEVFQEHAVATGQEFDLANPFPFFLNNVIGIDTGMGYKVLVPTSVNREGAVYCPNHIPRGALVAIMGTTVQATVEAVERATKMALRHLCSEKVAGAIVCDCVTSRLRMGEEFRLAWEAVNRELGMVPYVGCNLHGQIVRTEGQFGGFHNCTAMVCLVPE